MNRKEAAVLLPIIKAFSEGKEIEGIYKGTKSPWFKVEDMDLDSGIIFRIKPEPVFARLLMAINLQRRLVCLYSQRKVTII